MLDEVIEGATLVTGSGRRHLDLGIENGRIAGWYAPGLAPAAARRTDARGLLLFPGSIDPHFHCDLWPAPGREDFASGTAAAAAGGVTTVIQMPTPVIAAVAERRRAGEEQSSIDFGLWGMAGSDAGATRAEADAGVSGFKVYMLAANRPGLESLYVTEDAQLLRVLRWIAATGLPAVVHCELQGFVDALTADLVAAGQNDPTAHPRARPPFVEEAAVAKLMILARALDLRIHVPHVTHPSVVARVREGRAAGVRLTAETCPHYLYADETAMQTAGPYARINPPLRAPDAPALLWQALRDGDLDMVSSDHVVYTPAQKECGWESIWSAGLGHPGVETTTPLVLSAALDGRLSLERAAVLLSEAAARAFGYYPRKGSLSPGADADLLLFDPQATFTIDRAALVTRGAHAARLFDGMRLRGRILRTVVRGRTVFAHDGESGAPGWGQLLTPHDDALAAVEETTP